MEKILINKELINIDSITSIEIYPKRLNTYYYWKSEIKFLGLLWRKTGFYDSMGYEVDSSRFDEDSNFYVEKNWVYYSPFVKINLNDQSDRRIYFKSVEQMESYVNDFKIKNIGFFYL